MVAWITVIHQIGGASVAYLAGVLRVGFGTYFEASMLAGLFMYRRCAESRTGANRLLGQIYSGCLSFHTMPLFRGMYCCPHGRTTCNI